MFNRADGRLLVELGRVFLECADAVAKSHPNGPTECAQRAIFNANGALAALDEAAERLPID
jgi:hypothetical protein